MGNKQQETSNSFNLLLKQDCAIATDNTLFKSSSVYTLVYRIMSPVTVQPAHKVREQGFSSLALNAFTP